MNRALPERQRSGAPSALVWILLALMVVVVVLTHQDYGATWDEGVQARYGELTLDYFRSGGTDSRVNEYLDLYLYGPLVEMVPALFYEAESPDRFRVRHLYLGLLAALSIPGIWLYGRLFGGATTALFSVLAVITLPRFYGHWFNNSKDLPFAVLVIWFMWAVASMFRESTLSWRRTVPCGLVMGLTLCVRPGGFPLLGVLLAGGTAAWLATRAPKEPHTESGGRWGWLVHVASVPLIAWPLMVLPWPWAHEDVLLHPLQAMLAATRFATVVPVLFEGLEIQSDRLPWYYVPKYILIGTPVSVLLLALLGIWQGVAHGWRDRRSPRSRMIALTLIWLLLPLLLFAVVRPNVYGGMRHFLFVLPALGVLAALGATAVFERFERSGRGVLAAIGLAAVLLLPVIDLIRLHPYQMTYYNGLVGGTRGASRDYWTDYYLSSYKEAIEWVNQQATSTREDPLDVVIAAGPPIMLWAETYASDRVRLIPLRSLGEGAQRPKLAADYYIGTTRRGMHRAFPESPVVHRIGRDGATFTVIRGRLPADSPP